MSTTPDTERAEFEERFSSRPLDGDGAGNYVDSLTDSLWYAWRARAALPPPAAPANTTPAGWVLDRRDDATIIVSKPKLGGYVASKNDSSIASSVLYELAADLLSTAPAAPAGGEPNDLIDELLAWKVRFPEYAYRPQDDCVALKMIVGGAPSPAHGDAAVPAGEALEFEVVHDGCVQYISESLSSAQLWANSPGPWAMSIYQVNRKLISGNDAQGPKP